MPTMNTGVGSASGRGRPRREPVRVEDGAQPVHERERVVDLPVRGRGERAVGPLVVRERGLPLSAVVVDLAEREVEVALDARVAPACAAAARMRSASSSGPAEKRFDFARLSAALASPGSRASAVR